ncbi:MAG TPA: cation diffusion facilitator family transporter [Burkholderiales bacterium]
MATASTSLERYAWLSVAAALATIGLKTLAWWLTDSVALLSDALESLVNLAAALLALSMLRLAARAPNQDHPFGFSKAEYFSAGIEGALIVLAAAGILAAALPRLVAPQPIGMAGWGLALTALATVINLAVGLALIRAGRRHRSITLEADGRHLMTDVWTSGGVLLGVALALTTGWLVLDPLVALAVAAHIIWTGIRLMRRSVTGLLDGAIPQTDRAEIDKLFAEYSRRYGISFHALLTRRAAARRFITFHMLVPDQWSVAQAHRLSEEIEERVRELVDGAHVTTHIEPISDPASYDDQKLDR